MIGRESLAEYELIFPLTIPSVGYTAVHVARDQTKQTPVSRVTQDNLTKNTFTSPTVSIDMQYYTGKWLRIY